MGEVFVSLKTSYAFDSIEGTEYFFYFDAGLKMSLGIAKQKKYR